MRHTIALFLACVLPYFCSAQQQAGTTSDRVQSALTQLDPYIRANLEKMIVAMQGAGISVVLAGMTLPRNYGADFIKRFEALYAELAKQYKIPLVKFELEPLAAKGLMQPDGIHPTAGGYKAALPSILAGVEPPLMLV